MATTPFYKTRIFRSLAFACLTLGLAPFLPEPHLIGKLRWLMGGANGMTLMDWGDLLFHGAPWVGLIGYSIWYLTRK
ncbi:hypothetical protein [Fibrella aquatica]|uniref:hypothetical protein n=1 Tax=Fibrella aquatica TaxID=3242487 RepID=UPI0035213006